MEREERAVTVRVPCEGWRQHGGGARHPVAAMGGAGVPGHSTSCCLLPEWLFQVVGRGKVQQKLGNLRSVTCSVSSLLSLKLRLPKTHSCVGIRPLEVDTWAGQSPALPCHTSLLPVLLLRSTCWVSQKRGPVLSAKVPMYVFFTGPLQSR